MTGPGIGDTTPLETYMMPVDTLTPFYKNARRGNVDLIAESLQTNGQFRAIVVNLGTMTGRAYEVLAGNHTLQAAVQLGWESIAAHLVDVDELGAVRIVAVDNRANDVASYDNRELLDLLEGMHADELVGTGYNPDDLTDLYDLLQGEPDPDPGDGEDDGGTVYAVAVLCTSKGEQTQVFERLHRQGYQVRRSEEKE